MSIFSKIINREIPAYIIAEDEMFIAFLDIFPLHPGHTLVVPKVEIDKAFDLNDDVLSRWMVFAKPIAKAIESVVECNRCGVSVLGLEVPHAHMHLIRIDKETDLNISGKRIAASENDLQQMKIKLIAALSATQNP